ncbi:MAG: hypothetical protein Tsb0020_35110 [Haliangiales bacterium]
MQTRNLTVSASAALVAMLFAISSCTLIYEPSDDNATGGDQAPPGGDPDFLGLVLNSVEPPALFEGEGGSLLAPAVPVVVYGVGIAADATLSIALANGAGLPELPLVVDKTHVSADGTIAATAVRLPVVEWLTDGDVLDAVITLTQGDESASIPWNIVGLDELIVTEPLLSIDILLNDLFSIIIFDHPTHIIGAKPARLFATQEIIINALVDVDGLSLDGLGGAGSCPGGGPAQSAPCGPGSGGGGTNHLLSLLGLGGGGGGFGLPGQDGAGGGGAGLAGLITGDSMLSLLSGLTDTIGNRGGGGGGGGSSILGLDLGIALGGAGGCSGGIIELTSGGLIHFGENGAVSARGEDGETVTGAGGGGGGSGGGILLRARVGIIVEGDAGERLNAEGGSGGDGTYRGGDGGDGRIRIDIPTATPPQLADSPQPHYGPMWSLSLLPITNDAAPVTELFGQGAHPFSLSLSGLPLLNDSQFNDSGVASVTTPLEAGLNIVCAVVDILDRVDLSRPEASNCISIAYLP